MRLIYPSIFLPLQVLQETSANVEVYACHVELTASTFYDEAAPL